MPWRWGITAPKPLTNRSRSPSHMGMSKADKSGGNSGRFVKGGDPRQGRGPAKGAPNAGRPPNEFRQRMQQLASREEGLRLLEEILLGEGAVRVLEEQTDATGKVTKVIAVDGELYLKAREHVVKHGYGLPAQPITGPDGGPVQVQVVNSPAFKP